MLSQAEMNYEETIEYLFGRLPMYQKVGRSAFKKDLTNIVALCTQLGHAYQAYPCIHVAGTNGKGTVSHMISNVLREAGLRVGLYTSPHYQDFRERIRVNDKMIEEEEVVRFVDSIGDLLDRIEPSFFEITVAMAFDHFEKKGIDVAVIETGLGGRLDSTNIITPILSIITNISLDHCEMLGETHYQIAHEKAGIIKESVPVVVGQFQKECDAVFYKKAREENAPISFASVSWSYSDKSSGKSYSHRDDDVSLVLDQKVQSPFLAENTITSLEAIRMLKKNFPWNLDDETIKRGMEGFDQNDSYRGRWQILENQPMVVVDSAHNYAGLKGVLGDLPPANGNRVHMVLGFVRSKNLKEILTLFPKDYEYYLVAAKMQRAMPIEDLLTEFISAGFVAKSYSSVKEGFEKARNEAHPDDLIFIGGSTFVVAEALAEQ